MNRRLLSTTAVLMALTGPAFADIEAAQHRLDRRQGRRRHRQAAEAESEQRHGLKREDFTAD